MMLSRMADALYWMARNLERADDTARLLDINLLYLMEMEEERMGSAQWDPLLRITGSEAQYHRAHPGGVSKEGVVTFLTQDLSYASSIRQCIQVARENARVVRDQISREMWESINPLWHYVDERLKQPLTLSQASAFYRQVRNLIARFRGLTQDTMMRGEAYGFYRLGTSIERMDMTARTLDVKYHILLPSVDEVGSALDYYQWAALLKSLSGFEAYRRKYPAGLRPVDVTEFILFSAVYPRSMQFSLTQMASALHHIGFESSDTRTCQALQRLRAMLQDHSADAVFKQGLHEFLQELLGRIADLHSALQTDCFDAHGENRFALPD